MADGLRRTDELPLAFVAELTLKLGRNEKTVRRRDAVLRVVFLPHLPLLAVGRFGRVALATLRNAKHGTILEEHGTRRTTGTSDLLIDTIGVAQDLQAVD